MFRRQVYGFHGFLRKISRCGFIRAFAVNLASFLSFLDSSHRSIRSQLRVIVSKQPEGSFADTDNPFGDGFPSLPSFPRARPAILLLPDTIRCCAHCSSSGLPIGNEHICLDGCGGSDQPCVCVCSRTHDSGTVNRLESSSLSMISNRCVEPRMLHGIGSYLVCSSTGLS